MELTFEKWEDGRWFIVLPDYDGPQEDLEMVDGADKLCELLSYDGKHTRVKVVPSNERKEYCQSSDINKEFELVQGKHGLTEGSYYQVNLNQFKILGGRIWLCPVTLFVLGQYPEYIYITKLDAE